MGIFGRESSRKEKEEVGGMTRKLPFWTTASGPTHCFILIKVATRHTLATSLFGSNTASPSVSLATPI